MASLYISYWATVDKECAGDPIFSEVVTTSSTSALSGTIPTGAVAATVESDAASYVTLGTGSPTAAVGAGSFYLGANYPRDLRITGTGKAAMKFAARTVA